MISLGCRRVRSYTGVRHVATIIDGHRVAQGIYDELQPDLQELLRRHIRPTLVPIVVGDLPQSNAYIRRKLVAAQKLGIDCRVIRLAKDIDQGSLLRLLDQLNHDDSVHGIIVQLPLPDHLDQPSVCNAVLPHKDVDGFSASSLGSLIQGGEANRCYVPCTSLAVSYILKKAVRHSFAGLRAVVIGRSHNVGLPIATMLATDQNQGGFDLTTTICHRRTQPQVLRDLVRQADVVVSAAGVAALIQKDFIKPGACVIDVGISRLSHPTRIVGDVHPQVSEVAGWLTPVPGGVGPCTVACLLYNTVQAAKRRALPLGCTAEAT